MSSDSHISTKAKIGKDCVLSPYVIIGNCQIGQGTKVRSFVQIEDGVKIGKKCKIQSHTFICDGVNIDDYCFVGHGAIFANDNYPRAVNQDFNLETEADWKHRFKPIMIGKHVTLGSGVNIIGGITIGERAMVGMGSVVTKDIPPGQIWLGNPARYIRDRKPDE